MAELLWQEQEEKELREVKKKEKLEWIIKQWAE